MKTSQKGIDLLKQFEGISLTRYLDVAGKPTIGIGHLLQSDEHFSIINREQAEFLLRKDLAIAERCINASVKVPLSQNQFDALACFIFNVGDGAFSRSTLLKELNRGNYIGAASQFLRWTRAGGKVVYGLERRRKAEKELFTTTDQPQPEGSTPC